MTQKLALSVIITFFLMMNVGGTLHYNKKGIELSKTSWIGIKSGTIYHEKPLRFQEIIIKKREPEIPLSEINQLGIFLKSFIEKLESCVNQAGFDRNQFEMLVEDLAKEIVGICNLGETSFNGDKEIIALAEYAKYLFQIMVESMESLKNYQGKKKYRKIVQSIIKLNVWLLTSNNMESSEGKDEYSNKLALHLTYLKFWRDALKNIKEFPLTLRIMFEKQLNSGEIVLRGLLCQVSSDDEDFCIMD